MTKSPEAARRSDARGADDSHVLSSLGRVYLTAVLGIAGVAVIAISLHVLLERNTNIELHGREVARVARDAMRAAGDREAAIRGYLLTHDSAALAPIAATEAPLRARLDSLVALTADNPDQQRRADELRQAVILWDSVYARSALARIAANPSVVTGPEETTLGNPLYDIARNRYRQLDAAEEALYRERVRVRRFNQWSALVGVVAGLVLLWFLVAWLRRRLIAQAAEILDRQKQLEEQATELEEQAVELEEQLTQSQTLANDLEQRNHELGETIAALGVARDDAAAAHRDRAASAGVLDVMIERVPVAVAILDPDLRFRRLNDAFATLGGLSVSEYIGRPIGEVLPHFAAALAPQLRDLQTSNASRPPEEVEVSVGGGGRGSSARRHFMASVFPVRVSPSSDMSGAGVALVETTEQRQLEAQLLQSQKMEAIGRLAGGIAHDFNNVLTAITGFSQLAANALPETNEARIDIEQVQLAATRAATLTRQLLAFSRQQVLQPRPLNLNGVVTELEAMLRRLIGADVVLETKLVPTLPLVLADPGQLEQVLLNLVINARDAMPDGGTLMIETQEVVLDAEWARTHEGAQPGPHVMLAVSDTGIGMDAPTVERIFEPFFTTKPMGKGTGLGLSTVYGIIKQTGGSVWVYSEKGKGTTFRVFLPRFTGSSEVMPREEPVRESLPQRAAVLVVEDDAFVRLATRRALESDGIVVHEATNGREGLEALDRLDGAIDLAITDLVMPEMGGHDFAQRLASRWPGIRVIFTSGYTAQAINRQALLRPGDIFLEKPFTPMALIAKVRDALSRVRV